MEIRKTAPADMDALRNLFYTVRTEEFPWERETAPEDFDRAVEGEVIYTACIDGVPAGFVSVWEPDCFVHNLFVDKRMRKQGVGYALLCYARDQYPGRALTLKCVQENQRAYRFYLHHGWSVVERVEDAVPYYLMQWR